MEGNFCKRVQAKGGCGRVHKDVSNQCASGFCSSMYLGFIGFIEFII